MRFRAWGPDAEKLDSPLSQNCATPKTGLSRASQEGGLSPEIVANYTVQWGEGDTQRGT
jgi:hypothetical protein